MKNIILQDPIYKRFFTALQHLLATTWHKKQTTLGQEAGISRSFMSEVVKGKKKLTFEKRNKLANICGYSYDEFIQIGEWLSEEYNLDQCFLIGLDRHIEGNDSLLNQINTQFNINPPIINTGAQYKHIDIHREYTIPLEAQQGIAIKFETNVNELISYGTEVFFEQWEDKREGKEAKDWEDYISGASEVPSSGMINNAIQILNDAKKSHKKHDDSLNQKQIKKIEELSSNFIGYRLETARPTLMDPAIQILQEALKETGVKINNKQKEAVIKILRKELKESEIKTKDGIMKYLEAFGK